MNGGIIVRYDPVNFVDPSGLILPIAAAIVANPAAAAAVAGMIASGIIYYGSQVAADIGKGIRSYLAEENAGGTIYVDPQGNAIPTPEGGSITGSPDGDYIQGRDSDGNQTGVRKDGGHNPKTHPDERAQNPHGHVPGVTNPDGTPWLPVRQSEIITTPCP